MVFFILDSRLSFPVWLLWLPEAVTHAHLCSVALLTEFIYVIIKIIAE